MCPKANLNKIEKQSKVWQEDISSYKVVFKWHKNKKKQPRIHLYLKVEEFKWHITVKICFKEKPLFSMMLSRSVKL